MRAFPKPMDAMLAKKPALIVFCLSLPLAVLLGACATGGGYNPTVFEAQLETERLAENPYVRW
jgi:hypothetical protein